MKQELFSVAFVALVVVVFCRVILVEGASPFRGDIPLQFYPWKVYTQEMLAEGEIPYWNPHTHAGTPFLANMQSAVYYPLDLFLFLFPKESFFGLSLFLHLLLGALGCYFLARMCEAHPLPAIIAGVAYGLNGFAMIHIPAGNHLTYLGAAWAPWMFLAAAGVVLSYQYKFAWGLAAAFITTLHFLCGHPQMAFYSFVFSSLFCLIMALWKDVKIDRRAWNIPLLRAFGFGLLILLGLAMAAIQLFPTLEYLGYANRAVSIELEKATEFSFAPHRLITLLFPEFYGTKGVAFPDNHYDHFYYWSCAYAGVIVPLLALAAVVLKRRPATVIPLLIIGVLGLLLAWGRGNPIYAMVYQLPGFGSFRAPAKFLPYYLVPVCVLAALGVQRLSVIAFERQQSNPSPIGNLKWSIGLVGILVLVVAVGSSSIPPLYEAIRQANGLTEQWKIQGFSLAIGCVLLLSGIAVWMFGCKAAKPRFSLAIGMAILLCLDLFTYGSAYLNNNSYRPQQIRHITAPPQEIGFLKSQTDLQPAERVMTLEDLPYPNYAFLWDLNNLAGYDPMSLTSYNDMLGEMEGWEKDKFVDNVQLKTFDHPVLDALNVRFVLTTQNLKDSNLKRIFQGDEFNVFERTSEERSYLAWSGSTSDSAQEIDQWQPMNEYTVKEYSPHRIEILLPEIQEGWVRIAEWDYPGWKAKMFAEGIETAKALDLQQSADGLRAIKLPENANSLVLEYQAAWSGFLLTMIFVLVFALLVFGSVLYQRGQLFFFLSRLMGRYY